MPFDIKNFKANGLVLGGARPSLFEVFITPPQTTGNGEAISFKGSFMIKASTIPPSIIQPIEVGYFGRKVRFAGDRTFANWAVTVLNDEDYSLRKSFERWHALINSIVPNLQQSAGTPYKTDAQVVHWSKSGKPIAIYNLVGLFPTSINQMPLDWDAINQIQQFDVEFAYDYWVPQGGDYRGTGVPDDFVVPQILAI